LPSINAIFWDVGGVLLSNAWDHHEREEAFTKFGLDSAEFEQHHQPLVSSFETGGITLTEYLKQAVFYRERPFTPEAFKEFMYSCSKPKEDVLAIAHSVAASGKFRMGTINNESRELNAFRIEKFGLRNIFDLFVSSCFVRLRKPDPEIYALALDLVQCIAQECCFIDDRPANLEPAQRLGMQVIQLQSAEQLRNDLENLGIALVEKEQTPHGLKLVRNDKNKNKS
jgi:putative hydrolase of the HAD superfamily